MDDLKSRCENAKNYPESLAEHSEYAYELATLREKLRDREDNLFSPDVDVLIWDRFNHDHDISLRKPETTIHEFAQLQQLLGLNNVTGTRDPLSRFIFIRAESNRDPLQIDRQTLSLLLTYHQVMASLLELMFSFGRQQYPLDFHFSGFFVQEYVCARAMQRAIPDLGRSGKTTQMCYKLESVEHSKYRNDPWSIRQAVIYHAFDEAEGRSVWITVKGNYVLEDRLRAESKEFATTSATSPADVADAAFIEALNAHMILCTWSIDNWRWYISFLDEKLQKVSRLGKNLIVDDDAQPSIEDEKGRRINMPMALARTATISTFTALGKVVDTLRRTPQSVLSRDSNSEHVPLTQVAHGSAGPAFSFKHVQEVQSIGEKAHEVELVLHNNLEIISGLREHFATDAVAARSATGFNSSLRVGAITNFQHRLATMEKTLRMHSARAASLAQLAEDRKSLLYGHLNLHNIKASKIATESMYELAEKTQKDTVSMKVITFITMFFLPATFISTIMSTNIISYQDDGQGVYHPKALRFFFTITVPLTVAVFIAAILFYYLENYKDKLRRQAMEKGTV